MQIHINTIPNNLFEVPPLELFIFVTALFEDNDNVDQIFALKLACFETKEISESSNNEAKKKLRQAKTKLEVLKTAIEIRES